ncbi:hypothetical protein MF408_10870 [Nocardioides sp. TF02-7]|nr:hypothetical protein [Nocardioides sp. TF02-7]UMG94433.1 hypothetical protein MF408_10870 [Nocardioides sp. TF02-7]
MAELGDEQPGETVEVAAPVAVVEVGALAPHDDRHVVVGVVAVAGEVHPEVVLGGLLQPGVVVHAVHRRRSDALTQVNPSSERHLATDSWVRVICPS